MLLPRGPQEMELLNISLGLEFKEDPGIMPDSWSVVYGKNRWSCTIQPMPLRDIQVVPKAAEDITV